MPRGPPCQSRLNEAADDAKRAESRERAAPVASRPRPEAPQTPSRRVSTKPATAAGAAQWVGRGEVVVHAPRAAPNAPLRSPAWCTPVQPQASEDTSRRILESLPDRAQGTSRRARIDSPSLQDHRTSAPLSKFCPPRTTIGIRSVVSARRFRAMQIHRVADHYPSVSSGAASCRWP